MFLHLPGAAEHRLRPCIAVPLCRNYCKELRREKAERWIRATVFIAVSQTTSRPTGVMMKMHLRERRLDSWRQLVAGARISFHCAPSNVHCTILKGCINCQAIRVFFAPPPPAPSRTEPRRSLDAVFDRYRPPWRLWEASSPAAHKFCANLITQQLSAVAVPRTRCRDA